MSNRQVIRLFGIPATYTEEHLEDLLKERSVQYKKVFFATKDGVYSAGYAFIEFESEQDKYWYENTYGLNDHGDAQYFNLLQINNMSQIP